MKQKSDGSRHWKNKRLGFRHELILTLTDHQFSWREAQKIVDAIFASVKDALKRKEPVSVDGFGSWTIFKPTRSRTWRLKQVVRLKTRPVFHEEEGMRLGPFALKWKPHDNWKATEARPPDRRSKKYKDYVARREQERHDRLLRLYKDVIIEFFLRTDLDVTHAPTFWNLRWKSALRKRALRPVSEAKQLIAETAVPIPRNRPNRVIDYVEWYVGWSSQLDVDREIWEEAEHCISADQRGVIYHR